MISILTSKESVSKEIGVLAMSRDVFKELGEPILFDEGDRFFVSEKNGVLIGFSAMTEKGVLKYAYIMPGDRGRGLFSKIYELIEDWAMSQGIKTIKAVSTNAGLPVYLKKGFVITHSFTNYHKVEKHL